MSPTDLLPPPLRAQLRALRLEMRRVSALRGGGVHRSRDRGAGLEFAQYRSYEPGDEPRRIDWKLYARSDRFFVREAERDSPLAIWLVLDASASMGQAEAGEAVDRPADWTRLDAGKALTAALAEVALQQGDLFGLVTLGGQGLQLLPIGAGSRQRDRLLLQLRALTAQGTCPDGDRLLPVWERVGTDALVIVISDFFDEACRTLANRLAGARRDVAAIQLLTVAERDFPFRQGHRFIDPETGQALAGDGASLRSGFLARFGDAQRELHAGFDAAGVRHASHVLDEPLIDPLRRLFAADAPPGTP